MFSCAQLCIKNVIVSKYLELIIVSDSSTIRIVMILNYYIIIILIIIYIIICNYCKNRKMVQNFF